MQNKQEDLEEVPEWVKIINDLSNKNKEIHKKKNRKNITSSEAERISLEDLVYNRLQQLHQPIFPRQIIRFPLVFSKICPIFCLTKNQAWMILKELNESGKIEIVPYQGIRIKQKE